LLLTLASKLSDNTKAALTAHFVNGWDVELTCLAFDILQPNLARSIARINEINDTYEQLKEVDLYHLSDLRSKHSEIKTKEPAA